MTATPRQPPEEKSTLGDLRSGDKMKREEFHDIYRMMPEEFRAELVGGIVYVSSPLKKRHGKFHLQMAAILAAYEAQTRGVEACDNTTVFLSDDDEVQPDLFLRILPECGGQSGDTQDEYVTGPPEFVIEISHSSRSMDLHIKRDRYAKNGVREYIVVCLQPPEVKWFDLSTSQSLEINPDGILRSRIFPGLWIHVDGLFDLNYEQVMSTLDDGINSLDHNEFCSRLQSGRKIL